MAKVQNTLIGRSSGSVGGATFTTWKGINVLKSKAVSVANPNTIGQQSQRNRMTAIVAIFRLIAGMVRIGFKTQAIKKSEYNAFVSENIEDSFTTDAQGVATFVPANLKISKGTIGSTALTSISPDGGASFEFVFPSTVPLGGNANDTAIIALFNATKNEWAQGNGIDTRSGSSGLVTLPSTPDSGDVLHGYLGFKSFNSDEVSDSTYQTLTVS